MRIHPMWRRLFTFTALLLACACVQQWSSATYRNRKRSKQAEISRWEDEGGAPAADSAAKPADDRP